MSFYPKTLQTSVQNSKRKARKLSKKLGLGVTHRAPYDNVFHCCVQKTASQWFKAIFSDDIFYQNTGLPAQTYSKVGLRQDRYGAVPLKRVATPLYINHANYLAIPKPKHYRTFFCNPRSARYYSLFLFFDPVLSSFNGLHPEDEKRTRNPNSLKRPQVCYRSAQ